MSQGAEDGVGKNDNRERPEGYEAGNFKRVERVFLLLDHLQKQGNIRLQTQFEDQRQYQILPSPSIAKPPVSTYQDFLKRLVELRKSICQHPRAPIATDYDVLLRQSEDFLAAVAAPATSETIATTRGYIKTRTDWALQGWRQWAFGLLGPWNRGARDPRDETDDGAFWLARSARLLEIWAVTVMCATVALSVYAMAGRVIENDQQQGGIYFGDDNDVRASGTICLHWRGGSNDVMGTSSDE